MSDHETPPNVRGLTRATPARTVIPEPSRRWRTRVFLPLGIVVILLGLLAYATWDTLWPATPVRILPVVVKAMAGEAPGTVTVQAPGWLEPAPHPHYVAALTSGVIDELKVLEGETVTKDQVVATLIQDDARFELDRAKALLAEQEAAVATAKADLDAATKDLETLVGPKEAVARATAMVAGAKAKLIQLQAEIAAAESAMRGTKDEYDRKSGLVDTQAVSRGEVERLRLKLEAERAKLRATEDLRPVLQAELEAAQAQLDAARENAKLLIVERRTAARAQARLDAARAAEKRAVADTAIAQLRFDRTEIRAPRDGIVMARLVSPGSRVFVTPSEHSSHVMHLYDPTHLQVRVDVPLADAAKVGVPQRAEIVVDALPDKIFEGRVSRLVHLADIAKNTVEVKVEILDPASVLKPEMLARVRFLAEQKASDATENQQRVLVARSAVRESGGQTTVFLVTNLSEGKGRVVRREITLGTLESDGYVDVRSGLGPGDQVVVDPPPQLNDGDRVAVTGGDR